jgi:hypothetical protein
MAKAKAKAEENGSAVVEQVQRVTVGIDRNNEQVLQLNMDNGVELVWEPGNFRKLPESVVNALGKENLKRYLKAEVLAEEASRKAAKRVQVVGNPLMRNPLSGYSEYREEIRARRGWHQCWANPGRDFDEKMRGPYKQVRKPTDAQEKEGFEPGEENGEVLKRMDGEGKVEAIALECPQHLFEQYLQWMSDKSSLKRTEIKNDFFGKVEGINRDLPRDKRIMPMDDDGDVQE